MSIMTLPAIVVQGHRIASGNNPDTPYPDGSITLQKPVFKSLGLDLDELYDGTINLSIAPKRFRPGRADYTFEQVTWIAGFPAETFSLFACRLAAKQQWVEGFVYYPHPETKTRDFHSDSLIEVLAPYIPDLEYGQSVELQIDKQKLDILD